VCDGWGAGGSGAVKASSRRQDRGIVEPAGVQRSTGVVHSVPERYIAVTKRGGGIATVFPKGCTGAGGRAIAVTGTAKSCAATLP
jgi:hypothetical protein